jgi:hypothetical protein
MKQKSTLARPFTDADFDDLLRTVKSNAKAIGKLERSTRRLDETENNRGLEMERSVQPVLLNWLKEKGYVAQVVPIKLGLLPDMALPSKPECSGTLLPSLRKKLHLGKGQKASFLWRQNQSPTRPTSLGNVQAFTRRGVSYLPTLIVLKHGIA